MAVFSPAYAKNVIRRTFAQLVDPSPDAGEINEIWEYFDNRCAYCDRLLTRGLKEAHIDHLVSASLGGQNHISNRVLSCSSCNEKEKRDAHWEYFLETKAPTPDELAKRARRIEDWQVKHQRDLSEEEAGLFNAAAEAAAEVTALFAAKYLSVRDLRRQLMKKHSQLSSPTRTAVGVVAALGGRRAEDIPIPKARYTFMRLCFKADIIEPLEPSDHFRIDTPDGSFQLSKEEFARDFENVINSRSYQEGGIYHYPMPPQHTLKYLVQETSVPYTLDDIISRLDRHRQRATYGAVSSLVGTIARSVMQTRPKNQVNSWVVSQTTGLPTGYHPEDMHPHLRDNPHVIKLPTELAEWLAKHGL